MSDTSIEWADKSWNPIVGCSVVSPGCTNCYAMRMAARIERMAVMRHDFDQNLPSIMTTVRQYDGLTEPSNAGPVWTGKVAQAPDSILLAPLKWRKPARIFVNSMGDLFHESVPDAWIDRVFAVMALAPQHTFIVLTKRSKRMRQYLTANTGSWDTGGACGRTGDEIERLRKARDDWDGIGPVKHLPPGARWWPLPNVWLGVSAEDQERADERIPDLLATPAAKRLVSAEPLLGEIDFRRICIGKECDATFSENPEIKKVQFTVDALVGAKSIGWRGLDWIIVGGESGKGARPMHPDWPRSIRDQCAAANVPFFFKQWGEWLPMEQTKSTDNFGVSHVVFGDGSGSFRDRAYKLGKHRAGALLDGVEHKAFPQ